MPRSEIARQLLLLLSIKGVLHPAKDVARDALVTCSRTGFDIVECVLAARARARAAEVLSFDLDFDRLGCRWREP